MVSLKIPNGLFLVKQILVSLTFLFIPLFFFDLGFSGLQIGVLMSSITVVAIFSTFPIGVINDKFSIKYVTVLGMLFESVMFFGLYMFTDFLTILVFFILGALGGNMIETSIRGLTFKVTESGCKGKRLGRFQAVASGGSGIGVLIGGLLLFTFKFSGVLLMSAITFLVLAVFSLLITEVKKVSFPMRDYKSIIMKRETVLFLLPLFVFGFHWGAENTSYALFLREGLGLGFAGSGIYMSIPIIVLSLTALKVGSFIDRKGGNRKIFFIGMMISGIGHVLMTTQIIPLSFIFRLIHEIGDGLTFVSYYVGFSNIFKTERISGEASIATSIMMMGAAVGSLIFGPMGHAYGFSWPLIISGALSIVIVFILFPVRKNLNF